MSDRNVQVTGGIGIGGDVSESNLIAGDVHAGTFIGHDQIIVISDYTGAQLREVLASLTPTLSSGQADLRADVVRGRLQVSAPGLPRILLSDQAARDLFETAKLEANERAYLSALRVHPRYGRWASQFVPLAGAVTTLVTVPGWTDLPPEFTLLEIKGTGERQQIERTRLDDITQATARHNTLVVLGEPGAGKTTTLHKLALDAANQRLTTNTGKLPLLVSLADYRDYPSPFLFLETAWKQVRGDGDFANALRRGELLLLVDALNEMPFRDPRDYRAKLEAWRRLANDFPGNQLVFSCRSRDYSEPLGAPTVEIERLDNARVREFLEKYFSSDQAQDAWHRLESSPLLDLVRNPYYLSMLAYLLKRDAVFPSNRAALFGGFVQVLLDRERRRDHPDWLGEDALSDALAELAFALQPLGEGTRLPRADIVAKIPAQVVGKDGPVPTPGTTVVRLGLAATLLDTEMSPDGQEHVRFYHHQLQEYFAAHQLLTRWRSGEDQTTRWRVPRLKNEMPDPRLERWEVIPPPPGTGWEEPTILAAGVANDAERATFVEAVGKVNSILAARCLTEAGIPAPTTAKEKTQNDLLREMTDRRVHLRYRIAAGDALGKLGDPRFQEIDANGTHVLVPPFVEIPAGAFWMGSGWWDTILTWLNTRAMPEDHERTRHRVELTTFYVSQFPVTNAEYACFMEARGYDDERWWKTPSARKWLQESTEHRPRYWNDTLYNNPAQPVVGVTWYEAMAYCAWLTEQLRIASREMRIANTAQSIAIPNSQFVIRLSTEAEWEKAARGKRGWLYPWGNVWDRERANAGEANTRRTTPVGIFTEGATPAGVFDFAGNVWEWTLSKYTDYPYQQDDGREDLEGTDRRVVRGGSYSYGQRSVRCAYRLNYRLLVPDFYYRDRGLRLVLSPISDSELG